MLMSSKKNATQEQQGRKLGVEERDQEEQHLNVNLEQHEHDREEQQEFELGATRTQPKSAIRI